MTAAKVMDIMSRLPGCAGQAADAPDIWIRLPRRKWPKSWSSMEDPVVPLERNLYGLVFFIMGLAGSGLSFNRRLFFSVFVDDIRLAGKEQNIDAMWKVLNTEVDLGEPTSTLDHVSGRLGPVHTAIARNVTPLLIMLKNPYVCRDMPVTYMTSRVIYGLKLYADGVLTSATDVFSWQ